MVAASGQASADLPDRKRPFVALLGAFVITSLLIVIPLGVTRPMPVGFLTHAELVSLVLLFFLSLPAADRVGSMLARRGVSRSERLLTLGWLTYMALYLTSCLLCQRLHVGHFISRRPDLGYIGDALMIAALYLIYAKPPLVAYPRALAVLVAMAGLATAHLAWFPLTALPGMVVILAWQIGRLERAQLVAGADSENTAHEHFETLATPEKRAFLVKPNEANLEGSADAVGESKSLEIGSSKGFSPLKRKNVPFKILPFIY